MDNSYKKNMHVGFHPLTKNEVKRDSREIDKRSGLMVRYHKYQHTYILLSLFFGTTPFDPYMTVCISSINKSSYPTTSPSNTT